MVMLSEEFLVRKAQNRLRSKENTGSRLWNGRTGAINRDPVLCIWREKESTQSSPQKAPRMVIIPVITIPRAAAITILL